MASASHLTASGWEGRMKESGNGQMALPSPSLTGGQENLMEERVTVLKNRIPGMAGGMIAFALTN